MTDRVLIVDDERVLRANLVKALSRAGHLVDQAGSAEEALERLAETDYAVVLTDLRMPGLGGLGLLERLRAEHPQTLVLVATAYGSLDSAIQALRAGAQDYLLKPLVLEEVERKVQALLTHRALEHRVQRLRRELHADRDPGGLVATSAAMGPILDAIRRVGPTRATVLLQGESGAGKELVARALHAASENPERDFIAVNLAAVPPDLVDATLFGHERGAFTGAEGSRPGVFRAASGGTVFLDEVGELPAAVQVKLLRVLENREVHPVGSARPIPVDFRLLAATHRDLRAKVAEGSFREDLFFRLSVVPLQLPPLRDRPEDLAPLATTFLRRHASNLGKPTAQLSPEAMRALRAYSWPGNVRELSNVLERAVLLTDAEWLTPEHLALAAPAAATRPTGGDALKPALERFEREHILAVLRACDGDKVRAAERLGVHLATLYRRLERLDDAPKRE